MAAKLVPTEAEDAEDARRHPAGLKYLLTELVCNATGGPEVVTAKGFDEAKLGVPVDKWAAFCALGSEAATVFPTPHHRAMILDLLSSLQPEHGAILKNSHCIFRNVSTSCVA